MSDVCVTQVRDTSACVCVKPAPKNPVRRNETCYPTEPLDDAAETTVLVA